MSETAFSYLVSVIGAFSGLGLLIISKIKDRMISKREKALKNEQADFDKYVKNWIRANRTLQIANEVYTEIRNTDPEKIHDIILDYVTSKEFSKADLRKLMKGYEMVQCINCMKEQLKNGCHE